MHGIQSGRYWALNLNTNKKTIEMRLFRGTLNYNRFIACFDFADAISRFIKTKETNRLLKQDKEYFEISWDRFLTYCKKNKYLDFLGAI